MTVAFAGHARIPFCNSVKEAVKAQLRTVLQNAEPLTCYLGGYGDFDMLCACACRELKEESLDVETVYVTPYMSLSEQLKIKDLRARGLYDTFLYPPLESTPPKFAIAKRNEWMMKQADLVIVYVCHSHGGAYTALRVAERKKKPIINIYELLRPNGTPAVIPYK